VRLYSPEPTRAAGGLAEFNHKLRDDIFTYDGKRTLSSLDSHWQSHIPAFGFQQQMGLVQRFVIRRKG